MKVGLYARVSTSDKEQNPLTQLLPMREYPPLQLGVGNGDVIESFPEGGSSVEPGFGVGAKTYSP
ncbi:hypothetical protein ACFLU7_00325 [Chloroflexota bacterium]